MAKKYMIDMEVARARHLAAGYTELVLTGTELPEILPGQFVNILTDSGDGVLLRRPISVNDVRDGGLWLLVKNAGRGTASLCAAEAGDKLNVLLPLGRGFDFSTTRRPLLIGGGVGTAPLLYLGRKITERGVAPTFLLAARTAEELVQLDLFREVGEVRVATEDGSLGEKGLCTAHSCLTEDFDSWCVCGPLPMMKAVARMAKEKGVKCQVSLENKMACGLGACLCCVEDTKEGNVCTCTEGPVFDIEELKW